MAANEKNLVAALQTYATTDVADKSERHRRVAAELASDLAESSDAALQISEIDDDTMTRIVDTSVTDDHAAAREVLTAIRDQSRSADAGNDAAVDAPEPSPAEKAAAMSDTSNVVHQDRQGPSWAVLAGLAVGVVAIVVGLVWFLNRSDAPQSDATRAEPAEDEYLSTKAPGAALVTTAGDVYVVEDEPRHWLRVWRGGKDDNALATQAAASGKNVAYLLEDGTVRMHKLGTGSQKDRWIWSQEDAASGPKANQVAVTRKYVVFTTDDGGVRYRDVSDAEGTAAVLSEPSSAPPMLAAGGGFAYLLGSDKKLMQIDLADPTKEVEINGAAAEAPVTVLRARAQKVATLDQDGVVTIFQADQPTTGGTVVWDGSGYTSPVKDIAIASGSVALLFEDGTVRAKNQEAKDPALLGRLVWKKTDDHPGASAVGAKGDLILIEVEDAKARSFDIRAEEDRITNFFIPVNDVRPQTFAPQEP